jgi:hypothetical protein
MQFRGRVGTGGTGASSEVRDSGNVQRWKGRGMRYTGAIASRLMTGMTWGWVEG